MRPKDKGTKAETAVANYLLVPGGYWTERRALRGNKDRGDIAGIPGLVIEVKDCQRMELAGWLDEVKREIREDELGVVWHKRRGKGSPRDWYVTMSGSTFLALLKETGR